MEFIITDKTGNNKYRIFESGNGLCFEIFKWFDEKKVERGRYVGQDSEAGWRTLSRYPSTLEHAFRSIAEMILRDGDESFSAAATPKALKDMVNDIEKLLNSFVIKGVGVSDT